MGPQQSFVLGHNVSTSWGKRRGIPSPCTLSLTCLYSPSLPSPFVEEDSRAYTGSEKTSFRFLAGKWAKLRTLSVDHDPYIQEEVAMIRSRLSEDDEIARRFGTGSWVFARGAGTELSRKGMGNRVFLVFCAFALQNLSGAAAINYYSPTLFGSLGISDVALYTGIYGLVKAISSLIFYMLLIDLLGRRRPVIVSSVA